MAINWNICSLNVRGLRNKCKRGNIYEWLKRNEIHLAFLQETYFSENQSKNYSYGYHG